MRVFSADYVKISVARFVRKTPLSSGQDVDFEQLVRGIPPFYGQTEDSGSTNISNKTQTNQFQLGKYSYRNNGNALNTLTLSLGNTYFCNWALNIAF